MKINHKMTDTEQCVMEVLWDYSVDVRTRDLLDLMKERGKDWKRQTLNTILFRLEEKGIVSRTRAYVKPAMSRTDLLKVQTQELLEESYGGKPGNFFAALIGKSSLTPEDESRLDALLEELKGR